MHSDINTEQLGLIDSLRKEYQQDVGTQKFFSSEEAFVQNALNNNPIKQYLQRIKHSELSEVQTMELSLYLMKVMNIMPMNIRAALIGIEKTYGVLLNERVKKTENDTWHMLCQYTSYPSI